MHLPENLENHTPIFGFLSEFYRDEQSMAAFEADWETSIARTFVIPKNHKKLPEIAEEIRKFYFPNASSLTSEEKVEQYTKLFSDAVFNFHMSTVVSSQRQFAPVYLYHYSLHGGQSFAALVAGIKEKFPLAVEIGLILLKQAFNYYVFGEKPRDYGTYSYRHYLKGAAFSFMYATCHCHLLLQGSAMRMSFRFYSPCLESSGL